MISTEQAESILARTLEFRIRAGHVEFLSFEPDKDGKEKTTVRAVQPAELWAWQLWNQSVILVQQVMETSTKFPEVKMGVEGFKRVMEK